MNLLYPLVVLICVLPLSVLAKEDLEGASASLARIQAELAANTNAASKQSPFAKQLAEFEAARPSLSPEDAATRWVELLNTVASPGVKLLLQDEDRQKLLALLPPPASWPHLGRAFAKQPISQNKQRTNLFQLFAAMLLGDPETIAARAAEADPFIAMLSHRADALSLMLSRQPEAYTKILEEYIARVEELSTYLWLPNLAVMLPRETATAILARALTSKALVNVRGKATEKLAREVAVANLAQIQRPQWGIVRGADASCIKLYEAFSKMPSDEQSTHERNDADFNYLAALLAAGRLDDAKSHALKLTDTTLGSAFASAMLMEELGQTETAFAFFKELMKSSPSATLWDIFVELGAKTGGLNDVLTLALDLSKNAKLDKAMQGQALAQLRKAYLAMGKIDEAIDAIEKELALPPADAHSSEVDHKIGLWLKVVEIGEQGGRDELRQQGIAEALELAPTASADLRRDLAEELSELGRYAEAEKLFVDALRLALTDNPDHSEATNELANLCALYVTAGRHSDALELLTDAPWWGAADLSDIITVTAYDDRPLGELAARALLAANRQPEAIRILRALLVQKPKWDPAYELLIELECDYLLPFLDQLFTADPFEERPLIWKAWLKFQAGDTQDAEAIARKAVAIDPSDGEMGKNLRMRVYAVLGDILEARGDAETAKVYRGAVEAVRLSEKADSVISAGLIDRGISMYREALEKFADAYCIQSRLAIQLAAAGRMEEAEAHYVRAYELMPDSFGRMESHCFGCERAFSGKNAETLAEKTFVRLIAQSPQKPQLHYLLGYLREEQGRYEEASRHFRDAVRIDPDYINAWTHLGRALEEINAKPEELDEVVFNLLRIDPRGRNSSPDFSKVSNFKKLWETFEAAQRKAVNLPVEQVMRIGGKPSESRGARWDTQELETPGEVIAQKTIAGDILNFALQF